VSSEVEQFHFVDLLSLHFRAQLDIPFDTKARGLLYLMWQISGLPLPHAGMYPPPLVEAMREELHEQHSWLCSLRTPPFVHPERNWVDWALFWGWVDRTQERTCASLAVDPYGFVVQRSSRITPSFTTFIVIEPDDEG
jgi:hypothetical protein